MTTTPFTYYIGRVINRHDLSYHEAEAAMNLIMRGEATPAQIGSYLTALRMKGEVMEEIAGSAAAMRSHVVRVPVQLSADEPLCDTCGTGGDGTHTFNISTTAAFVVAGAGHKVAKHGNRSVSSRSGSADLLLALGGNLTLSAEQVGQCVDEVGIGFLYAIHHHPAMKHAIGPRREMAQRTIFNVLGPLTNPAGASHQVIGVYDAQLTRPLAETLQKLGSRAAFVVHGADGLDEFSTTGINHVAHLSAQGINEFDLEPLSLGIGRATLDQLRGGSAEENAAITRAILQGVDHGPKRDIVLLNAAAALCVESGNFSEGLAQARHALDSGAALETMNHWIMKTNSFI